MTECLDKILDEIYNVIWNPAMIFICLFAAFYFSISTRFIQIRMLGEMVRSLFKKSHSTSKGTTSFQAFSMALSGRVGVGNIVGVATAIAFGGPGAVVWMWIIAFFGAGSAFAESTLAQIYKSSSSDFHYGGPACYIEKGLHCKLLGVIFAIVTVVTCGLCYPPIQCNSAVIASLEVFPVSDWLVGLILSIFLALIIFGGLKRIANVASVLVPFMAIVYITLALITLFINFKVVPQVLSEMIRSAFGLNEALSGILGMTILWGVKRGIYSNEAGQGTGAIASAVADVKHPVCQGLAQSFSVYVDTFLVCSATAIIILSCKTYNVIDSVSALEDGTTKIEYIQTNPSAPLGEPGSAYVSSALGTVVGKTTGDILIAFSLVLFAFTTMMAYYYYAESSLKYILVKLHMEKLEKIIISILKLAVVLGCFFGSISKPYLAWKISDIGLGAMLWLNIISILLLSPIVWKTLKDYEHQKKFTSDPTFDPKKLNISGASFWDPDSDERL